MPTLDPADYWRLRAVTGDLQRLDAQLAVVRDRRDAVWRELVEKYALNAAHAYQARDEDCSLTVAPGPPD